jgi:hypothetical protein
MKPVLADEPTPPISCAHGTQQLISADDGHPYEVPGFSPFVFVLPAAAKAIIAPTTPLL